MKPETSVFIAILSLLLLFPPHLYNQSKILDAYIEQGLNQNLAIRSAQLSRKKQLSRIEQAQRLWGPTVDFNANYLLATGGRQIVFPLGDLFNPAYAALNELTGTNNFPENLANEKFQLTPNNFIDAQLNVSMPLINSSIRYNQKIQNELLLIEDLNIALEKDDITLQIKTAYFNYLKSREAIRILDSSLALLDDVLAFNRKLVRFDKATDEIIYDVEFQIENLRSQKAKLIEQNTVAQSLFNLLLYRELNAEIEVDEQLIDRIDYSLPELALLQTNALENRQEFQQLTVAERVNDLNQSRIQKEGLPTLGVQGGIGIQTENFDFDAGGPLYTIGVGMSVSLFDNGQRKKRIEELTVDRAMISNDRSQLEQKVQIEIIQTYYALQSLLSQIEAEEAAELSAFKSFQRFKTRYENDKALLIELLQAQNRLTTSQLSKALTKYDFLIKKAELTKATAQ